MSKYYFAGSGIASLAGAGYLTVLEFMGQINRAGHRKQGHLSRPARGLNSWKQLFSGARAFS
jgi:hypothetical protein